MSKRDSRSYLLTVGLVGRQMVHDGLKQLDFAESVARCYSAKHPDLTYRIWEEHEYAGCKVRSSQAVATYKAGDRQ